LSRSIFACGQDFVFANAAQRDHSLATRGRRKQGGSERLQLPELGEGDP
jgi:hypothetical protein